MKSVLFTTFTIVLCLIFVGCFSISKKDAITEYDSQYMKNAQVTSDIQIAGAVKGTGTRNELFGFIKWGDRGRASYEGQYKDYIIDDKMSLHSKQSAVYNALGGKPENFLIDPQFHTKTKNFLIFKSYTTEVVGQQASRGNYRQIKRFNTDGTETIELDRLPHTYTVNRNGREATNITVSRDIPSHVTNSIQVIEAEPSIGVLNVSKNSNYNQSGTDDLSSSLRVFETKMENLNRKIQALNR